MQDAITFIAHVPGAESLKVYLFYIYCRPWYRLFDDGREDHVQDLFHPSLSASSMIPFMDTSSWLGVAGELSLTKLPSTLFHMCNWWKTKVNEVNDGKAIKQKQL